MPYYRGASDKLMKFPANPLVFLGPTIVCIFSICFLLIWLTDKTKRPPLFFSIASFLFCLGSFKQIFSVPAGAGANAVITAFIYTLSVLLICQGLLERSGKTISLTFSAAVLSLVIGGIAYYYYVEKNLIIRIYILNFGFGAVFLYTVLKLHQLRKGNITEQFLFWVLLLFSLQFFIRTGLTISGIDTSAVNFGTSVFWLTLQYSLAVFGVSLALALLAVVVHDKLIAIKIEYAKDHLTGLLNRRDFDEQAESILANRGYAPVSVLLIDVDHFKTVNDMFGHSSGDSVLRVIGAKLKESICEGDISGRIGGEEFAIVLRNKDLRAAQNLANNIRAMIERTDFPDLPYGYKVTVSIGIASAGEGESLFSLVGRADRLLYIAKIAGRNRVVFHDESIA